MNKAAGVRGFARDAAYLAVLGASSLALMGPAWAQARDDHPQGHGGRAEAQHRDGERRGGESAEAHDGDIVVTGRRRELESPRYVAPLLDTPQTVTVVSSETIEQQNLLGLRDILSTLPGITFGAGEGGGGYGDSINLRGYSANNDITVDGVRDSAQYSRTDPFDLEQVEVTNGANSVYGGAGSVGGSINLITKRPGQRDRSTLSLAGGSDNYQRATLDMNQTLGDDAAFRLNLMAHQNDQPGRDFESYERWGVAPALTLGLGQTTEVTFLYLHQQDNNAPQYGVPYALNISNNGPLPGVDRSDYFGYRNLDHQDTQVDQGSLIVEHRFGDNISLRNLTRYQVVTQDAVTSAVQGSFCLANNVNPYVTSTGAAQACTIAPNTYAPSGPRGNVRNTENTILANQTDLSLEFNTGGVAHNMVIGAALTREEYELVNGSLLRNANGTSITEPSMVLSNPSGIWTGPINFIPGGGGAPSGTATASPSGGNDGTRDNLAIYLFDSAELSPHWEINGGVRAERNEGSNTLTYYTFAGRLPGGGSAIGAASPGAPGGVLNGQLQFDNADTLLSYRLGLVYKPVEHASLYFAYGNSQTPSQSAVSGACTSATCNVDPEEAVNYELGVKYDAMGGRLQYTAAIFRNDRTNFRVASGSVTIPEQQLDGESRVDGVALGVAGLITDHWSVFANYTYLDSEVLQSISDLSLSGGAIDIVAGDPLPNTPKHALSLWTTYEVSRGLMIGYGATYQGEYTFTRASATAPLFYTDDYWVHRAMVSYEITEGLVAQLNINNLTDEVYYERIRNNTSSGWATPGAARNAVLSLSYQF